jgi:hypothetical protein
MERVEVRVEGDVLGAASVNLYEGEGLFNSF